MIFKIIYLILIAFNLYLLYLAVNYKNNKITVNKLIFFISILTLLTALITFIRYRI